MEERVASQTHEMDEASRKLDRAQGGFSALFSINPIPTALTRLEDGALLQVNDEFLAYFGLQREEVIGHSAQELHLGLETQEHRNLIARAREQGGLRGHQGEILRPSGEKRNVMMSLQFVNIDNREAFISAFVDITDRLRAEEQVRALVLELTVAEPAERQRLAKILHDDLQQRISAAQMQLSFLRDAYERNDLKAFAADFPQLETWLAEAIQVTRQLNVDLSPPIQHGEDFVEAILWLAAQMQERYGLTVSIRADRQPLPLNENMRGQVFYAVRELLLNIVKHAGTLEATVDFERRDGRLHLTVRDQGKGFDEARLTSSPFVIHGLLSIRHRLNLLGCSLNVKSQPGQGTTATIGIPLEKMDS